MAQKAPEAPISLRQQRCRILEDFVIVWLDPNINKIDADYQNSITRLRCIAHSITTFSKVDECVDCLTQINDERVLMIVSGNLDQQFMPLFQDLCQIHSIYVLCDHGSKCEQWTKDFPKIKSIFTQMEFICNALKQDIRQSNNTLMPISIVTSSSSSSVDLNELDQSFMYTQLLKEILLEMEYDNKAKTELIEYCRLQYAENDNGLQIINEFEENYARPSPIWWYTRECFTYWMLNKALRTQDVEIITKMGFFVQDLHRQIEQLHSESNNYSRFTVYRGQGMSNAEFEKMNESKGGLLSFNNFLSTSTDREIAMTYADSVRGNRDLTGVVFRMEIDPSVSSTPFCLLDNISYYSDSEKEILFSMHTVFRIGEIKSIDNRLWEVDLRLTSDNDQQLIHLTKHMRKTTQGATARHRLSWLMIQMGEYGRAEKIYDAMLENVPNGQWQELAFLHHQLGYLLKQKGDLSNAFSHYKQSLDIKLAHLPLNDISVALAYSNIGAIYKQQNDLDTALEHFYRSLHINLHLSRSNSQAIAIDHNNIGSTLRAQGKYVEALQAYENSLEIYHTHLPTYHPLLAITYNNIAGVHYSMKHFSNALPYYEKTLEIFKKSLPSSHHLAAIAHSNIAKALEDLHRHKEAIEHALQAVSKALRGLEQAHSKVIEYQEYLDKLRRKVCSLCG